MKKVSKKIRSNPNSVKSQSNSEQNFDNNLKIVSNA